MELSERQRRLGRMKILALALLFAMIGVYVLAGLYEPVYGWLGYVRAFAEAGTVGALADWFAVTALFRHPLGIPIPHTAIIRHRKDEIGATLSRFVEEHFLVADALRPRLAEMHPSEAIANWLGKPGNANRLTEDIATLLNRIIAVGENRALREVTKDSIRSVLASTEMTPLVGQILELLLLKDPDQTLINGLLGLVRRQIQENRQVLQTRLSERSPWWLPKFVDRRIYERIVHEIEALLADVESSDDEEARERLTETLAAMVETLKTDRDLIRRGEALKEQLLSHPLLQRYLSVAVHDLEQYLSISLRDPESEFRQRITQTLTDFADTLSTRPELKSEIDNYCRDAVLYAVERYSNTIAGVISQTIESWDARATSERIELQVGRDLQFIRINGTLVGGFVGLTLYAVWHLFH